MSVSVRGTFIVALLLGCFSVFGIGSVYALANVQWDDVYDGTVSSAHYSDAVRNSWHYANCNEERSSLETYGRTFTADLCVVHRSEASLASYSSDGSFTQYALKKSGDTTYHLLTNVSSPAQPILLSNNTLLTIQPSGPNIMQMVSLDDVHLKTQDTVTATGPGSDNKLYTVDMAQSEPIKDESGAGIYVRYIAASQNNKYAAVEVYGAGIALVNLETHQARLITNDKASSSTSNGSSIRLAVSNDGKKVLVVNGNTIGKMYLIDASCGRESFASNSTIDQQCDSIDLSDRVSTVLQTRSPYYAEFNENSRDAYVYAWSQTEMNSSKLTIVPDTESTGLAYLALGDSYSSGEGDTEKGANGSRYYRLGTNLEADVTRGIPQNKCHISTRSYPYLLARGMDLALDSPKQWDTIACNGATAWDVKAQGSTDYLGRGDSLKGFDVATLKAEALNGFIAGRQKQIEFVKKYKPRVITLTIGGNDVGFGPKIQECATISEGGLTCSIATEDGRSSLGSQIRNQYDNLKSLYSELRAVSAGRTKIYVLGYPQFINGDEPAACGWNIGMLNSDERKMIHESVTYLNSVIKQAAKAAGVYYLDIENSLQGGRLCDDGQKYVTGISVGDRQESFHPNAKGHAQIASSVWSNVHSQSLLDFDTCKGTDENICPDPSAAKAAIPKPAYFGTAEPARDTRYQNMTQDEQKKTGVMDVILAPLTFLRDSVVKVVLHSDPVELGEFHANGDGSLDVSATIPSYLPAGYHTLIVTGNSPDGVPVQYEQIILVKGTNSNDTDENGIVDTQQACGAFMSVSGVDADHDGIDDACDPEITVTTTPQPTPSPSPTVSPTPSPSSSPAPSPSVPPSGQSLVTAIINVVVSLVTVVVKAIISILQILKLNWW